MRHPFPIHITDNIKGYIVNIFVDGGIFLTPSLHLFILSLALMYALTWWALPIEAMRARRDLQLFFVLGFLSIISYSTLALKLILIDDPSLRVLFICFPIYITIPLILYSKKIYTSNSYKYSLIQLSRKKPINIGLNLVAFLIFFLFKPNFTELVTPETKETLTSVTFLSTLKFLWLFLYLNLVVTYMINLIGDSFINTKSTLKKRKKIDTTLQHIAYLLIAVTCVALALLMLKVNLIKVSIFTAIFFAGIAVSFQDFFNNMICGIILRWDNSLKVGDTLQWTEGKTGTIKEINIRYTHLEDRNKIEILIPNSVLLSGPILNYSKSEKPVRIAGVMLPVPHNSDFPKICEVITSRIVKHKRILNNGQYVPKIFMHEHTEVATILEVRFWIEDPYAGIANIKSDVLSMATQVVQQSLGIYVPSPQLEISSK